MRVFKALNQSDRIARQVNTTKPRASHVNTGTSIPREELPQPTMDGPIMRLPKLHVETDETPEVTPYGGLVLVADFLKRFGVAELINQKVSLLKEYHPYHESDHILALVINLYVGGTCLEDISKLQLNEAARRILGACRIPDPTTSGDNLRRFDRTTNPGALEGLRESNNELQSRVWQAIRYGRTRNKKNKGKYKSRKPDWAMIDIDAHKKVLYGDTKEGADFNYKGKWSYNQLLFSLADTGECLAVRNRPGNVVDADGAANALDETMQFARPHFKNVLIRADSAFDRSDMRRVCGKNDSHFAFVGREFQDRPGIAQSIPEGDWKPFRTRAARMAEEKKRAPGYRPRRKKKNLRKQRARERGYKEKRLTKQWIAEVPFRPPGSDKTYRLVIRRKLIEHWKGQLHLFEDYEYRYVVTDLPESISAEQVIDLTYERCDQEKIIAQMNNGLAAWRMPVREFDGNCAWLECARLAWNLAKWIAQLALDEEVVRWEWKRFRNAFVFISAEVIKRSRQIWVRFRGAHRFLSSLVSAHQRLQL